MTLAEAFMKWRKERVAIEQVEHQPILDHDAPFSDELEDWRRLKSTFQAGDELWTFCSPVEECERFMGWQGIVLVRDGKPLDVFISAQN